MVLQEQLVMLVLLAELEQQEQLEGMELQVNVSVVDKFYYI